MKHSVEIITTISTMITASNLYAISKKCTRDTIFVYVAIKGLSPVLGNQPEFPVKG